MTRSGIGRVQPRILAQRPSGLGLVRLAPGGLGVLFVFAAYAVLPVLMPAAAATAAPVAVARTVAGSARYAGPSATLPVRRVVATAGDGADLIQAYLSARQLPAGTVAGIRPGSLHLASLPATGTDWAMVSFAPSPAADERAQVALQDTAATGVFTRVAGEPWRLRAVGGCGQGLPSAVSAAWGLSVPASCDTTGSPAPDAAWRATSASGRPSAWASRSPRSRSAGRRQR